MKAMAALIRGHRDRKILNLLPAHEGREVFEIAEAANLNTCSVHAALLRLEGQGHVASSRESGEFFRYTVYRRTER